MISEQERSIILKYAEKYNVSSVYLFGSSIRKDVEPRDIDIGVKGLRSDLFFRFCGELMQELPKPVDVVDLSKPSLFTDLVEQEGVRIYG